MGIIIKPVISEKATSNSELLGQYSFYVDTKANKLQIKEAVEKMFPGTKVAGVNTINMDGKNKRVRGTMTFGKTAKTKKAIVQLTEESAEIEIFQGL